MEEHLELEFLGLLPELIGIDLSPCTLGLKSILLAPSILASFSNRTGGEDLKYRPPPDPLHQ